MSISCQLSAAIPLDEAQFKKADTELNFHARVPEWYKLEFIKALKESTILDGILIPIVEHSPTVGYLRAMKGVNELNTEDILIGCNTEISTNGKYWVESHILLEYLCNMSTITYSVLKNRNLEQINEILRNHTVSDHLKDHIRLAKANSLMEKCFHTDLHNHGDARKWYQLANNTLNEINEQFCDKQKIHIIKSGVLIKCAMANLFQPKPSIRNDCLASLITCCEMLPNFSEIHVRRFFIEFDLDLINDAYTLLLRITDLIERFPHEFKTHVLLIKVLIEEFQEMDAAHRHLTKFRRENPDQINDTWEIEARINTGKPSSVEFLKRAINHMPQSYNNYIQLADYYASITHEYGKALEVLNQAMDNIFSNHTFSKIFVMRQLLLTKIITQNLWDKM